MTLHITFQTKYTPQLHKMQPDIYRKAIIFVHSFDKHSAFYLLVQFGANRCLISVKNTLSSMVGLSVAQIVVYVYCKYCTMIHNF